MMAVIAAFIDSISNKSFHGHNILANYAKKPLWAPNKTNNYYLQ